MAEDIKPALSPDEWKALESFDLRHRLPPFWEAAFEIPAGAKHASAAISLYRQPFGFTHGDVTFLEHMAELFESGDCGRMQEEAKKARHLAERIGALLPPK